MKREDIEKEFEDIVSRSQHLFNQPIKVEKSASPLGTYIEPRIAQKPLLPELDTNLDLISRVTRLLVAHDYVRESIYRYQQEKGILCITIIKELQELSDIEEFKNFLNILNKFLRETYIDPESEKRGCVYQVDITNYEEKHPYKKFLTELNNILQNIHTLSLEILQEYDMISAQYTSEKGIDETKILYFSIGNARIINVEPYNIPQPLINFINTFNEEVNSSGYATYLNVLYMKLDKKYRLDLTLGAAFNHRSLILFDPDPSVDTFEHTYIDGNYTRVVAWKKYLSDFSPNIEKEPIHKINNKLVIEKRKEITKSISEEELEKALAWKDSLFKVQIPKDALLDMVLIIYLINWDGIINHSSRRDIMSIEDEANIIYYYGLYALYNEQKKRYMPRYNAETQNIIRSAIRDTVRGIENFLLPE